MKIKNLKSCLYILTLVTVLISCKKDDDTTVIIPEADRAEQQVIDNDSILVYLSTHYYNSSFFESGTNHKYTDIIITELGEGEEVPVGNTLLLEAVGAPETTTYFETEYEYYILKINQGGGKAPKFTDQVRVRYEGSSMDDGNVFDSNITPLNLYLTGNGFSSFSTIRAWQLVMPKFNSAVDFSIDGNGIVNYNDFGFGVMFVPSGLAYFSGTSTGSAYDNLIFKIELLQYQVEDHDGDGIPSFYEDLDMDLDVYADDTDGDLFPNFVDTDDDDDDVLTFDELEQTVYVVNTNNGELEPTFGTNEYEYSRSTNSGVITITTVKALDTNSNGILDYLEAAISINYN